jgi:hypothetical protein
MPGSVRWAMQRAAQLFCLGTIVVCMLIAVRSDIRAQPAPGEDAVVLAADGSLGEAVRTGDRSVARKLLSLQFTFIDENGKLHERKEFLDDLKGSAAGSPSDVKVKVYGLVGMVTGKRKTAQNNDAFFLDIWAKQKGAWRVLTMQDVVLAATEMHDNLPEVPGIAPKLYECKNPCQTVPYRVRSPAEQDIVNVFQTIEKATIAHDAAEYGKHIAEEFMHYRSGYAPISRARRIAIIEEQKKHDIPALLSAVQTMRLWVYGDGAAMISTNGAPDQAEPLLHIARVWVRRNGQWQMAISVQTVVK